MDPVGTIASFCENFTSRKFLALLIFVGMVLSLFIGFESYTSHFTITRTAQEVDILERLVNLRNGHPLTEVEEGIRERLLWRIGIEATPSPARTYWSFEKFSWGISPWALVGLIFLATPTRNKGSAFIGAISFAFIFGFVAGLIPGTGLFLKALVIPWGLMVVSLILIVVIGLAAEGKHKQTRRKEERTA